MGIELEGAPALPALPAGCETRPFEQQAHGEAICQARNEAFRGGWGYRAITYEDFAYYNYDDPQYDPSLWVVAWEGSEVAGFAINHYRMGNGWVQILGVRPAWRGKGLGAGLLARSFDAFYQRGTRSIGLGVDASNPTGATELYRKAGMHIVNEFVTLEKELRAGQTA
jgi:ribosomal protein S18 acetylase RimI-like enzyme